MEADHSNIRITVLNKARLAKYKKKYKSYANIIEAFLDYFDITETKPSDVNVGSIAMMKKSSDQIIGILRNLERNKIYKLLTLSEDIRNHQLSESKIKTEERVTDDEAEQLVEEIGTLRKINKSQEQEIKKLNEMLSKNLGVSTENKHDEILKNIKKFVLELDSRKTTSNLKRDDWQIEKSLFSRNVESIINLINDAT